jgi:hypothetical protein
VTAIPSGVLATGKGSTGIGCDAGIAIVYNPVGFCIF